MARPHKEGLDYFFHDTNMRHDRKMTALITRHGLEIYGLYNILLEKIYDDKGYYMPFNDEDQSVMDMQYNIDSGQFLDPMFKIGLFNRDIYQEHQVLTSAAIQRRYLNACTRRSIVRIRKQYLLLNADEIVEEYTHNARLQVILVNAENEVSEVLDNKNGGFGEQKPSNGSQEPIHARAESRVEATKEKKDKKKESLHSGNQNSNEQSDEESEEPEYDSKLTCGDKIEWDGDQPIDHVSFQDDWNKFTGGQGRMTPKKREDVKWGLRQGYTAYEIKVAMYVRANDERLKQSDYLTDWNSFWRRKSNFNKWCERALDYITKKQSGGNKKQLKNSGALPRSEAKEIAERTGYDLDNQNFWKQTEAEGEKLFIPQFDY